MARASTATGGHPPTYPLTRVRASGPYRTSIAYGTGSSASTSPPDHTVAACTSTSGRPRPQRARNRPVAPGPAVRRHRAGDDGHRGARPRAQPAAEPHVRRPSPRLVRANPHISVAVAMIGTLSCSRLVLLGRFALGLTIGAAGSAAPRLDRTLLLWIVPLWVAPPMFSQDVYSYLAQGEITARGLDPYGVGPACGARSGPRPHPERPHIWREPPRPTGRFPLVRRATRRSPERTSWRGLLHRLLALVGVA